MVVIAAGPADEPAAGVPAAARVLLADRAAGPARAGSARQEGLARRRASSTRATRSSSVDGSARQARRTLRKQIAVAQVRREAAREGLQGDHARRARGAARRTKRETLELTPVYDPNADSARGSASRTTRPARTGALPLRATRSTDRSTASGTSQADRRAARAPVQHRAAQGDLGRRRLLRGHAPDHPRTTSPRWWASSRSSPCRWRS